MEEGYLKLWDGGCPSSSRIIEDIDRVLDVAYPMLYENRGIALHDLERRIGRRRKESSSFQSKKRGGKRVKNNEFKTCEYIHESIANMKELLINTSIERFTS